MSEAQHGSNPVEIFQNAWNLYRKVVDHDYMFHRAIYSDLASYLEGLKAAGPLVLVELGCGDASETVGMLSRCRLERYLGVDLSEAALALASENLRGLSCPVQLELTDMLDGLSRIDAAADVIFCGYALHHLSLEEKARFFELGRRALKRDGVLLLTDVMREPGQNRAAYLDAYLGYAKEYWRALGPDEFDLLCEHVRAYDFPESTEALVFMAKEAGFPVARQLNHFTWHQTWAFNGEV